MTEPLTREDLIKTFKKEHGELKDKSDKVALTVKKMGFHIANLERFSNKASLGMMYIKYCYTGTWYETELSVRTKERVLEVVTEELVSAINSGIENGKKTD